MVATSGLSRPAMARSREDLPDPDGPKTTVSQGVWLAAEDAGSVSSRPGIDASDKVAAPEISSGIAVGALAVEQHQRDQTNRQQEQGGAIRLGILKILHLIVERDGERACGAGEVAANHEDDAKLANGVGEAEHGSGKQ